jgi:hypothetical protein
MSCFANVATQCYPSDKYSDYMPEYFTADFCKGYYPGYNDRVCKTKTVCPLIGDYWAPC